MTTIQKTVDIPDNHRIQLDLTIPKDVPAGRAQVQVTILPYPEDSQAEQGPEATDFFGCLKNSGVFEGDSVAIQREMRDEWR